MPIIFPATLQHAPLLAGLGVQTFLESHGHSAPKADIEAYIALKFSEKQFAKELGDPENQFSVGQQNGRAAGYSKIVVNAMHPNIAAEKLAKLERLYVLSEYHGVGLGTALFRNALNQAKLADQAGIWLFVWKENHRAIRFYQKQNFQVIGEYDFPISDRHTNPNWQMYLGF